MQRIEVITGKERRRFWSEAEKLRIVAEADVAGVTQKAVARRNDVHPNQIYLWRKAFQKARFDLGQQASSVNKSAFLPVEMISEQKTEPVSQIAQQASRIDVALKNGRVIRIGRDFDEITLKRILAVLEGI